MTAAAMQVSYDTARPTERTNEVSSMPISELSELQSAVLDRFGCDSIFRGAVLVREQFLLGGSVWSGTVLVFDLIEHPTAARCYAWSTSAEGSELGEHEIVLHDEAVGSAQAAVRAYMLHKDDG